jgi:hypothetical protein
MIAAAVLSAADSSLGARIGQAAVAEQALQGPLDGDWTVRDARGRVLLFLRISDPVEGRFGGAWRDLATDDVGVIDGGSKAGGLAHLKLAADGRERAWLTLRPMGGGSWRGRLIAQGRGTAVTMIRG